jgi:hypothetical protein
MVPIGKNVLKILLGVIVVFGVVTAVPSYSSPSEKDVGGVNVITRDVVVIGGGSTGSYAAIRLRDLGKSVVVVERQDRLGGHTHTYKDPVTGATADYGVAVWHDIQNVRIHLSRFNVPVERTRFLRGQVVTTDFRTGQPVLTNNTGIRLNVTGMAAYSAQLRRFSYLDFGFDLPDPVPEDLLLPFGDFAKKYGLEEMVPMISRYTQGYGNILRQPTLYIVKIFGLNLVRDITTGSFLSTSAHDNSELYRKIQAKLGSDVLLNSHVVTARRDNASSYAELLVQTPKGLTRIQADKVVISIPPKLSNLAGFDLSEAERSLFGQFTNTAYYAGLLRNTGLGNLTVDNLGSDTPYNLTPLPGAYDIGTTTIPDVSDFYYCAESELPEDQVKADVISAIKRLRAANTVPASQLEPEFVAFAAHVPFALMVPAEAIRAGFYKDLYALQGQRRTYYTGAAFHTHDSSLLWDFTENLVSRILAE